MLEVYSTNVAVEANSAIPFENVSLRKGCTALLSGTNTIDLNKCGVYMVSADASAESSIMIQLYKNGVAQPQAQSTGGSPSFITLVQVPNNNSCNPCDSAVSLQLICDTAATLTNVNLTITKII